MAEREEDSLSVAEECEKIPSSLCKLIEALDAKWEKQFDVLKESIERRQVEDVRKGQESQAPLAKRRKIADSDQEEGSTALDQDVLVIQEEGDLEEEEERLCNPPETQISSLDYPESDLIRDIEEEFNEEESLGGKVRDDLAKIVNGRFKSKLGDEMLKKRFEAHKRPENCSALVVPIVNKEIWMQLPNQARKTDLKLAQIQRAVIKSATAITGVANELLSSDARTHGARVKSCTDAIALLGHVSLDLAMRRRTAIKPHVNKQLHRLCDESVPLTDKLFGDDLPGTLKDLKELDKLGASLSNQADNRAVRSSWYSQTDRRNGFLGQPQTRFRGQGQRSFRGAHFQRRGGNRMRQGQQGGQFQSRSRNFSQ